MQRLTYYKKNKKTKKTGCYAINSPATAEMQRLTMESTLVAENSGVGVFLGLM
jgi:hypothetical protein